MRSITQLWPQAALARSQGCGPVSRSSIWRTWTEMSARRGSHESRHGWTRTVNKLREQFVVWNQDLGHHYQVRRFEVRINISVTRNVWFTNNELKTFQIEFLSYFFIFFCNSHIFLRFLIIFRPKFNLQNVNEKLVKLNLFSVLCYFYDFLMQIFIFKRTTSKSR